MKRLLSSISRAPSAVFGYLGVFVLVSSLPNYALAQSPTYAEVLSRNIGSTSFVSAPPTVQVLSDPYVWNEAGSCSGGQTDLCQYSSLDTTFSGQAYPSTQAIQFRQQIAPFLSQSALQYSAASCPTSVNVIPDFQVFTHAKQYEINEASMLSQIQEQTGQQDFVPPNARKLNSYTGNQQCPYYGASAPPNLSETYGFSVGFQQNTAVMSIDNRFNPLRWIAPINEIHAHEQPSLSLVAQSNPTEVATTQGILASSLIGPTAQHILIHYDINVLVSDYRNSMNEYQFSDMMQGSDGNDLFSQTLTMMNSYIGYIGASNPEAQYMQQYFNTRYEPPTIQISLYVNLQQDGILWRDAELMLASKNYLPSYTPPFAPVSNTAWFNAIPEGGNNGPVAWTRTSIASLAQPAINLSNAGLMPIRSGGQFFNIPDGNSQQHLVGTIDFTDYYRYAFQQLILPGTSGYWNGVPESSINPTTGQLNPSEHHQINALGVIYEVHGPFSVKLRINSLDVQVMTNNASSGWPTPNFNNPIAGQIRGLKKVNGAYYLDGYACAPGWFGPIQVEPFVGGPPGSGTPLGFYPANASSGPTVAQACQDISQKPHNFEIPISLTPENEGQAIYILGISPNGLSNELVSGSGLVRLPKPSRQTKKS